MVANEQGLAFYPNFLLWACRKLRLAPHHIFFAVVPMATKECCTLRMVLPVDPYTYWVIFFLLIGASSKALSELSPMLRTTFVVEGSHCCEAL